MWAVLLRGLAMVGRKICLLIDAEAPAGLHQRISAPEEVCRDVPELEVFPFLVLKDVGLNPEALPRHCGCGCVELHTQQVGYYTWLNLLLHLQFTHNLTTDWRLQFRMISKALQLSTLLSGGSFTEPPLIFN